MGKRNSTPPPAPSGRLQSDMLIPPNQKREDAVVVTGLAGRDDQQQGRGRRLQILATVLGKWATAGDESIVNMVKQVVFVFCHNHKIYPHVSLFTVYPEKWACIPRVRGTSLANVSTCYVIWIGAWHVKFHLKK